MIATERALRRLARHRVAGPLIIVLIVLMLVAGALYVAMHDEPGADAAAEFVGELWLICALVLLAAVRYVAGARTESGHPVPPVDRSPPVASATDAVFAPLRN